MNIVLVLFDTLRKDHLGAYGNDWIHTPHLDAFAAESIRCTRAFPEAMPTLPFRRALHTGQRTFPFTNHRDFKGDFSGAPGWGPIPEDQDTISELLLDAGYRTALFTDCYHQFKPSKNFHRGFCEWNWVRGQETDRFRSGPELPHHLIRSHIPEHLPDKHQRKEFFTQYLTNNLFRRDERDYYPARLFTEASRWVHDNSDAEEFFLVIDSFDPHEPWEPPASYRKLYDQSDDTVPDLIQSLYAPYENVLSAQELRRLQANYAGEVTLCDRWFGHFMEQLELSGLARETLVIVGSDHGHNLGFPDDKGLVSKQGHPLTRAVADLVLMIRFPDRPRAGETYDGLLTNTDVAATVLAAAGINAPIEGNDVTGALRNNTSGPRTHVSMAWGPLMTVVTDDWWCNATIWGEEPLLHQLPEDALLHRNVAAEHPTIVDELIGLAVADAGGTIPSDFVEYKNRPGCTPYLTAIQSGGDYVVRRR